MKLYNLYKEVILEATNTGDAQRAIDEHLTANIIYDNGKGDGSESVKRYCRILNIGMIKGKPAIRVYQISNTNIKKDKYGREKRWKTFLLDKIVDIQLTNFKINSPITTKNADIAWNPNGDKTLGLGSGSPGLSQFGKKDGKTVQPVKTVAKYATNKYQEPIPSDPVEPIGKTDDKYHTSFKGGVEEPSDDEVAMDAPTDVPTDTQTSIPTDISQDPEGNVFDTEPEKYQTKQDAKNGIGTKISNFFSSAGNKFKSIFNRGDATQDNQEDEEEIEDYKIE